MEIFYNGTEKTSYFAVFFLRKFDKKWLEVTREIDNHEEAKKELLRLKTTLADDKNVQEIAIFKITKHMERM